MPYNENLEFEHVKSTKKHTRYKLKISKFGFYFYDSKTKKDLTLEMVLNKLNFLNKELDKSKIRYNKQSLELIILKKELKQ